MKKLQFSQIKDVFARHRVRAFIEQYNQPRFLRGYFDVNLILLYVVTRNWKNNVFNTLLYYGIHIYFYLTVAKKLILFLLILSGSLEVLTVAIALIKYSTISSRIGWS